MVTKADSPIGREAERHGTQMILVAECRWIAKTLLHEESSGCSDFLPAEETFPVEENVGGNLPTTGYRCASLGNFILVPLAWRRSTA